jgi:hypothetical protein
MDDRIDDTAVSTETYDEPDAPSVASIGIRRALARCFLRTTRRRTWVWSRKTVVEGMAPSAEFDSVSSSSGSRGDCIPYTGFGWEQYLVERLDSELQRAASSGGRILALRDSRVGVGAYGPSRPQDIEVLADSFKFRDLVFEYGQDGFAASCKTSTSTKR